MPVDRAQILQAEILEHPLRRDEVLDPPLDAVQRVIDRRSEHRRALEGAAHPSQHPLVARTQPQLGQMVGQPTDGRRVRASVVIDDDHHRTPAGGDVVQRLPAHPPGQRTVADHGNDRPALGADGERLGQPVGVGQRGRGVRVLDPVVPALGAAGIPGQPAGLAQGREPIGASGQDLVDVGLVAHVEQDRLGR